MSFSEITSLFLQYFFILTPFFVLAVFLSVTEELDAAQVRSLAFMTTIGIIAVTVLMFLFGPAIFKIFGITLDAFRIGSGALLFLSAVSLVNGKVIVPNTGDSANDLAIVPLAIPITVGPGAIGILIVMSLEVQGSASIAITAVTLGLASFAVGLMLFSARSIHRLIGRRGIMMLSKITGIILAALSCQMIFTGIAAFLKA